MENWVPAVAAAIVAIATCIAAIITMRSQIARIKADFATEQSAETAIHLLLLRDKYAYRSFSMIRHHVGGFEANELRRLLVRAGAIRFIAADETELWALRERVAKSSKRGRWRHPDVPQNKVPEDLLFPAVFKNDVDL